jgi:FKBP-type peptidyl-prolyl cis-trans isomerase
VRRALFAVLAVAACTKDAPKPLNPQPPVTMPNGVVVHTLRPGDGDVAKKGDKITIHFVGTLLDGGVFDSSRARGEPMKFWVGEGQVVEGLDQALLGVREGELRTITVPAKLGYGMEAKPNIPANSTLVFEVELLDVR